jgi:ribosome-associated protein
MITESHLLPSDKTAPAKEIPIKKLLQILVHACGEAKAKDIVVLDMAAAIGVTDYFVIASGRSDRQVQGAANRIIDAASELGITPFAEEGIENGQWIVLDFGDIVFHLFYEPVRAHYDLEGLWSQARRIPVREKPSGVSVELKAA